MENKATYIIVGIIAVIAFVIIAIVIVNDNGQNNSENSLKETSKNNETNSAQTENENETEQVDVKDENFDYATAAEEQMAQPKSGDTIAIMHVKNFGDITFKFFEDKAPKAVENFLTHAKDGYYNGVKFHRVMEDFMIQGGDPKGDGTGGESIWGTGFGEEIDKSLVPYRGALCMASAGFGNKSLGSQFFIVQAGTETENQSADILRINGYPENLIEEYNKYGGYISLFGEYTVFGQVISGMDVVDKIAKVEKKMSDTNELSKPVEDIIIESIDVKTQE